MIALLPNTRGVSFLTKVLILTEKPSQSLKLAEAFRYQTHKDHIEILPCNTFENGAIVVNFLGHLLESYQPSDYKETFKEWNIAVSYTHLTLPTK